MQTINNQTSPTGQGPSQPSSGTQLGPSPMATGLLLWVYNFPIVAQLMYLPNQKDVRDFRLTPPFVITPQAIAYPGVIGIVYVSQLAANPAQVIAQLWEQEDGPFPASGVPTTQILGSSGTITQPVSPLNFLHNAAAFATEPGFNLVDAAAVGGTSPLTWSLVDVSPAYVSATPLVVQPVQHGGAGQVNRVGVNFIDAAAAAFPGVPGLSWTLADNAGNNTADVTPVLTAGPLMLANPPDKFTANVIVTATAAPGTAVISSTSKTYLNKLVRIRFFAPRVVRTVSSNNVDLCRISLQRDGATTLADVWGLFDVDRVGTQGLLGGGPCYLEFFDTPPAGAHTYNVAAWADVASEWLVGAGLGGAGNNAPGFITVEYVL